MKQALIVFDKECIFDTASVVHSYLLTLGVSLVGIENDFKALQLRRTHQQALIFEILQLP